MERSVFDITLELQSAYSGAAVTVKRGDTCRTLRIRLTDGGRAYAISEGCTAVFTAVKPDGNHLYNLCRIEENTLVYDLTHQTTAAPGEVECELRLYSENGALLTTAAFVITVENTVHTGGDEQIASTPEATVLTTLLTQVDGKLDQMDEALRDKGKSLLESKLDSYSPAVGSVGVFDGMYLEGYVNRIVNRDLIPVRTGDEIIAAEGYAFNVFRFDEDGNYLDHGTYGYTEYTVDWDGFLRLAVGGARKMSPADYSPAVGNVSKTDGYFLEPEQYGYTRVVNQTLIPVKAGSKITASNGYAFNVFKFDSSGSYTSCGTYGYTEYTVDWDGYLRLAIGSDHTDMTDYMADACENVCISQDRQDMTDSMQEACENVHITAKMDVYADLTSLKQTQEESKKSKYIFSFPYNLDRLYVSDYETMEDLKTLTPAQFHGKMKALCDMAPGYATQTLLGKDADGNPLYKYVLEPNVPYIHCSRDERISGRRIDGVKIATPTIIILSGIHGIEASNDYAVYNFLKNLLTNRNEALDFIFRNLRLVIVPAICASGELANTYRNSQNINLNRDFPVTFDGTTQSLEAGYIKSVIDTYKDAALLIDMHTHQTRDIMSWNYTDDAEFKYVATRVANDLTHAWLDKYPDVEFNTADADYNPFTKVWVYHAPNVETTSSYYAATVWGIPAGTIEMRRAQPITGIHHHTDAVAFSYDMLVNFILSFCATLR